MPRIVLFDEPGSPDVLRIENRPIKAPSAGEVLLAVHAIGLNRAEIAFRQGRYLEAPERYPAGLGFEAAGVIEEVGPGVTDFEAGEQVATLPVFSMRDYGVYGDLAVVPASALTRYPTRLSAVEAASVATSSLTAYGGLVFLGKVGTEHFVLITAGSSSVGIAAIQIAKWIGAKVIATTRTAQKKQSLLDAGADYVIVTGQENLVSRVEEITLGAGADVCFDAVGGGMVSRLVRVAALGARVILYGSLSTELTIFPLMIALQKCLTVHAYRNFALARFDDERKKAERFIFDRLSDGAVSPVVDCVFPLERVSDAHRYVESNRQFGKVVLSTLPLAPYR